MVWSSGVTPAAVIRTRTLPSARRGLGTSTSFRPPYPLNGSARMALIMTPPSFVKRLQHRRSASRRQQGQQLLGGQHRVREARPIDLVRRLHALLLEGSGRIRNQRDVVAQLHAKARGGFNAGVRDQADEDELLDPPLGELGVEIGIGKAALPPVLQHHDVARMGAELGMELSTPTAGGEALALVRPNLGWVHMLPPYIVACLPAVMRHDDDLDTRR